MMDFFDISCKKASRLISDSQDRSLSWIERFQLHLHLKVCDACKFTQAQFASLKKVFTQYAKLATQIPPSETPAALSSEAKLRIKSSLKKGEQ